MGRRQSGAAQPGPAVGAAGGPGAAPASRSVHAIQPVGGPLHALTRAPGGCSTRSSRRAARSARPRKDGPARARRPSRPPAGPARSGTTAAAAIDGVPQRRSATSSQRGRSLSWPMADTTGTGQAATARQTSSRAPRQQRRAVPAAPSQDDHLHARAGRHRLQGVDDGQRGARAGHGRLLEVQRVAGKAHRRHRLDVLAHGGIGAAHHPDHRRQDRKGPAGPVEQTLGGQAAAGLGDELGDGALADRRHLLGDQMHLAPIVGPLQDARPRTPARRARSGCGGRCRPAP